MAKRTTVYIIERGTNLFELLEGKIGQDHLSLHGIHSSSQARQEITDAHNAVALLDITDIEDGFDLLTHLKSQLPALPIIIVSQSSAPIEIDRIIGLGAEDYMLKAEVTPEEAYAKIRRALLKAQSLEKNLTMETHQVPHNVDVTSIRVLIIEDDQFLRDLSTRKLKQEGFQVDIAIDGNDGFKKIEESKPDVVLLDIILPGIDGFEILKRVRANASERIRNTAVILLSNLGQESDVAKGERLGADDYLIKANFTIDEIIEKIKSVLEKKRNRKI